jgi:hypothetical protein
MTTTTVPCRDHHSRISRSPPRKEKEKKIEKATPRCPEPAAVSSSMVGRRLLLLLFPGLSPPRSS